MVLLFLIRLLSYVLTVSAFIQLPLHDDATTNQQRLRLSAVVNNEYPPYDARIECWELDSPFHQYPTIGTAVELANVTSLNYVILPPDSAEHFHHPPHPMFFILVAGEAHVTIPGDRRGLWIREGINPVIIATDILGLGHNTVYPGLKNTIAIQAPFKDEIAPEHTVLWHGPCQDSEEMSSEL